MRHSHASQATSPSLGHFTNRYRSVLCIESFLVIRFDIWRVENENVQSRSQPVAKAGDQVCPDRVCRCSVALCGRERTFTSCFVQVCAQIDCEIRSSLSVANVNGSWTKAMTDEQDEGPHILLRKAVTQPEPDPTSSIRLRFCKRSASCSSASSKMNVSSATVEHESRKSQTGKEGKGGKERSTSWFINRLESLLSNMIRVWR